MCSHVTAPAPRSSVLPPDLACTQSNASRIGPVRVQSHIMATFPPEYCEVEGSLCSISYPIPLQCVNGSTTSSRISSCAQCHRNNKPPSRTSMSAHLTSGTIKWNHSGHGRHDGWRCNHGTYRPRTIIFPSKRYRDRRPPFTVLSQSLNLQSCPRT